MTEAGLAFVIGALFGCVVTILLFVMHGARP